MQKNSQLCTSTSQLIKQVLEDLERDSGRGVGLYDSSGKIIISEMEELISAIPDHNKLIWEAPNKDQQKDLILRFGPNVNLGNINIHNVLALETFRVRLRADTLQHVL